MTSRTRLTVMCALVWTTACGTSEGPADAAILELPGHPSVIFLTLNKTPTDRMNALFEAPIVHDKAGCLRHATEDYTLIWPKGYTIVSENQALVVRDGDGSTVGRIGEQFRLGGGVLLFLHDGIAMTAQARETAERECPGQYWLVAGPASQ